MYFLKEPEPVKIPDLSGWRATYVFQPHHPGSPTDEGFRDFLVWRGFSHEMVIQVTLENYGQSQPRPQLPHTLGDEIPFGPRTMSALYMGLRGSR